MMFPTRWAAASNARAVANARAAATALSRRRVEREEVALVLADLFGTAAPVVATGTRAGTEADADILSG